jgi:hypothetical protein
MLGTDGIVPLKMSTVPTAIAAKLEEFDYRLVDARAPALPSAISTSRAFIDFR